MRCRAPAPLEVRRSCWLLYHADGAFTELGVTYALKVLRRGDLDRQIVRSQACEISIRARAMMSKDKATSVSIPNGFNSYAAQVGIGEPLNSCT